MPQQSQWICQKMELTGRVRIFERSQTTRSAKYTKYTGDGDAKNFQAITEASPYGSDAKVSKIEWVGHIKKRMETHLRKLRQTKVKYSDGKPIGGKGRHTEKLICSLTDHYGNAIREHKTTYLKCVKRCGLRIFIPVQQMRAFTFFLPYRKRVLGQI